MKKFLIFALLATSLVSCVGNGSNNENGDKVKKVKLTGDPIKDNLPRIKDEIIFLTASVDLQINKDLRNEQYKSAQKELDYYWNMRTITVEEVRDFMNMEYEFINDGEGIRGTFKNMLEDQAGGFSVNTTKYSEMFKLNKKNSSWDLSNEESKIFNELTSRFRSEVVRASLANQFLKRYRHVENNSTFSDPIIQANEELTKAVLIRDLTTGIEWVARIYREPSDDSWDPKRTVWNVKINWTEETINIYASRNQR